jgi:hypothetical protein
VDLADLGVVRDADDLVTADAALDGGQPRVLGAARIGVTVLAGNLERPGVDDVIEEDRLPGRATRAREVRQPGRASVRTKLTTRRI